MGSGRARLDFGRVVRSLNSDLAQRQETELTNKPVLLLYHTCFVRRSSHPTVHTHTPQSHAREVLRKLKGTFTRQIKNFSTRRTW